MAERKFHDLGMQEARTKFIVFFMFAFTILVLGRLFQLQVLKHDYYLKIASTQHLAKDQIPAKRGKIYVKDEVTGGLYPLAQNQTLKMVFGAPEEMYEKDRNGEKIDKKEEVAEKLAQILEGDKAKYFELFKNNRIYVPVKKELTHDVAEKIKAEDLPGVYLADQDIRNYPEGTLAGQLLGYVNGEGEGNYGLEQYFNEELSGTPGQYEAEIDPTGRQIAFGKKIKKEPEDGADLVLTINRDVQSKAEQLIAETVEKFKAEKGSIIVMNPENGEILAMANAPTYDPNKYKEVTDYSLFKNSCVADVYEPGSIFKAITMASGLDQGKIEPDTKYEDTGKVNLDGYKIMNSDKKAHGLVDMTFALAESLNTGTVHVLNLITKNTFFEYIKKFGFGVTTGIEQPSEGEGTVYSPDNVNDHTYATISFGQSITVTPIQMISSFAAIANGGNLVKPHLVAEKRYNNGKVEKFSGGEGERVISEEAAAKARKMLVEVVNTGHGKTAKVKGYSIAGKTGTAQVPRKDGRGYDPSKNIGSFVGFGPSESAKYVVLAKVDSPKGVPWAESSAAPVVGKMLDFLFKYYQVPPTENK